MVSMVDAPEKGRRPVDISYITTPSEDIRAVVDFPAERLLRAHLLDGAHDHTRVGLPHGGHITLNGRGPMRGDLRQSEVQYFGLAARRDHDVRRLDIPVSDSFRVRFSQSVGDLSRNVDDFGCF